LNRRDGAQLSQTPADMKFAALAWLSVYVSAKELTPENWDTETAGKSVFIKFLAPW